MKNFLPRNVSLEFIEEAGIVSPFFDIELFPPFPNIKIPVNKVNVVCI